MTISFSSRTIIESIMAMVAMHNVMHQAERPPVLNHDHHRALLPMVNGAFSRLLSVIWPIVERTNISEAFESASSTDLMSVPEIIITIDLKSHIPEPLGLRVRLLADRMATTHVLESLYKHCPDIAGTYTSASNETLLTLKNIAESSLLAEARIAPYLF